MSFIVKYLNTQLIQALALSISLNMLLFLIAYFFSTDKITDLAYSLTFICIVLFCIKYAYPMSINTYLVACMVLLWASRLGGYLFSRVLLTGQDHRFDGMRESFLKFGGFWFFQGISIWIILLPTMLFLLRRPDKISLYSYIGLAVFLVGFFIESIADMQKFAFKQNPSYAGKWIETGLWKYSRHPNYFGEVLVWLGIWIYTLPVFTSSWLQLGVSVISPVYITLLITLISGIPILEASADKRWGENKAYKSYKARTSSFIPWFPKSKNGSS